ncbi:MAG TPA: hypothetical protein V6D08_14015 [Candidatus Obscuribacterales bacterium]
MTRFYVISSAAVCAVFIYASLTGWKIIDLDGTGGSKPAGPGHYHK